MCLSRANEISNSLQQKELKTTEAANIKWIPPPAGWIKLNSDGSVDARDRAGAGGLLRGEDGNWILGYGRNLGKANSLVAGLWGLRDGLILAKNRGVQFLINEVDARAVLDLLYMENHANLKLMPLVLDFRELCDPFGGYEGNTVTGRLTT